MKNLLLATTALVLTAGVAAAEVSFSGYQRFGVKYEEDRLVDTGEVDANGDPIFTEEETFLDTRFRLNIDVITETDGGVKLEARVRMQADDGDTAGLNGARFSASAGGLRMDLGNIAGAIDNMPNYYGYEIGLTDFLGQYNGQDFGFDGYSSTGTGQKNAVYARYAFGAFAIAGSYSDDAVDDEEASFHVAYTGANFGVALGYANSEVDDDLWVLTGNYDFGTFDLVGFYANSDIDDDSYGLSADIEIGAATSIQLAYGDGDDDSDEAYGIGFKHNLGGGAFLRGGVGQSDDTTIADLGVRFDF
ncbi:porin [Sulfitobacter sp. D35]|uniref:porin n=1 Tax=Sulfitobacter sp. D35 TaxID=3083252 RepID=UPI00296EA1B0|nr:porin [Sulfitobacter sp. D35]MDW4498338.1 porin [Sulfitobacter sp. D35]